MNIVVQKEGKARRLALLSECGVPLCVSVWSKSGEPSVLALPNGECYAVFPFANKYAIPKHLVGKALRLSLLTNTAANVVNLRSV